MSNFIKLNRKLLESETFSNPITLKIWIWIMLKAEWKPKTRSTSNGKGYVDVKLKRGQLIFGRKVCAEKLEMSESSLYRHILKLKDMGNIKIESNTHYSIITVCNYDTYQYFSDDNEQPNIQSTIRAKIQPSIQPEIQHTNTIEESKEREEEIQLVKLNKIENEKSNEFVFNHKSQGKCLWGNGLIDKLQESNKRREENN